MIKLIEKQNWSLFNMENKEVIVYQSNFKLLVYIKKYLIEFFMEPGPKGYYSYYVYYPN